MTKILLTEDQIDQRELYHDILTSAGYQVWDAWSAAEAIELFQRYQPDVVIMDIQMPGMDGIEAMGHMISAVKERRVPVILYTAFPAHKANFLTWAADAFVVKSGDPDELVAAVHEVSRARGIEIPIPAHAK